MRVKGAKLPRRLPQPTADDFGAHLPQILQVQSDRFAIGKLMEKLPPSERKMLPEIQQTVDALYERATDLARTLHAMDSNLDTEGMGSIDERIAALAKEPDDPERARRINLLQRQRQTIVDLQGRRSRSRATWSRASWRCRTSASICSGSAVPGWRQCSATLPRRRSRPRRSHATWTTRSRRQARSAKR